jgi:hypothetical protein
MVRVPLKPQARNADPRMMVMDEGIVKVPLNPAAQNALPPM